MIHQKAIMIVKKSYQFLEGTSIKMLILRDCQYIDDFCLSRLYKISNTLEFLDISGCTLVTDNGLAALCKLR